jgi:hypothetical protein
MLSDILLVTEQILLSNLIRWHILYYILEQEEISQDLSMNITG